MLRPGFRGKYIHLDPRHPRPLGKCDRTNFICNHSDLRKQMEFVGKSLVWTGLMVHKDYLDKPNPANIVPNTADRATIPANPRPDATLFQKQ